MSQIEVTLADRVVRTGDESPGNWNFAADIVELCHDCIIGRHRIDYNATLEALKILDEAANRLRDRAVETEFVKEVGAILNKHGFEYKPGEIRKLYQLMKLN